ncbi:Thiol:disulfide interchange protein DsbD precursor [Citrobacter werkmanii]|uniref:Thiol:disulfide interchange protein DsbD n=1 Tax=Citrobacter werkmanii TaxID=67827 RepID=A0A9N8GVA5_9ENTR|nr:protein-disulfide reductase DsbD [Citrobacter werkmanii]CAB5575634.1 Thiol:disulfide interchange protein DsbD precursor [Citrobacter werkmanii]CAB5601870.1 Thiol:disulfide interchange protein DsbD precursor [Citrobacter werkmanii]CAB5603390.1 Thiol:disulfide interchange protein DsbD precursor [Citrobacter werkmanii]CAB5616529.1 Thiol:disulfide interchange protein DsbD precursor [Citrobacter werkmanii]CAB5622292.1 Thiol:disulfide interchange protein DsbD precursor [Citrobacter werkmanii]
MAQRILTLILLLCSTSTFAGLFDAPGRSQFVPADRAFVFDFQQNQHDLNLSWQVKDGYYLYRKQISITPSQADIAEVKLPPGVWHEDEFYGKSEIYRKQLNIPVTVNQAATGATLTVTYQGCADAGFCYPPETKTVPLSEVSAAVGGAPATAPVTEAPEEKPQPAAQLPFSALWALLIGIGIAFTPCVLPMYPLISGIVLGGKQRLSTGRALLLTFIYVQGMALTYTALGLVVAAAGLQFQAALQHPYVLIGFAIIFTLLALSMFGLFTLQLPSSLQTRLTLLSNRQQGGSPGSVFAMGAIAGLICSPCTTAPLSAILLYIAQSGNMWLGGGTLYLYALGMGLPLMLITVFGNRLLPKSGPWMEHVKTAFGFVILALPVFLLERIIGDEWGVRLWSLLGVAFFSWAFITSLQAKHAWMRIVQIVLLAAALVSVRPLQDWAFGMPHAQTQTHLNFTPVASVEALNQALAQAKGRPVMLDLYADWCVACKEFEKYTFSDPQVQQALGDTVLLQADVTANNAKDVALLKHLQVLGLPTILFFDAEGKEHPEARVTGFMDAATFSAHLRDRQP